jgi:hypothetical protein
MLNLILYLAVMTAGAEPTATNISVWPRPQHVEQAACGGAGGGGVSEMEVVGPVTFVGSGPALTPMVARYADLLFRHGPPPPATLTATPATPAMPATQIVLSVEAQTTAAPTLDTDESYSLRTYANDTIAISAPTQAGALYGLETLSQLLRFDPRLHSGDGGYMVPCGLTIDDAPRFAHRELMLDPGRYFLPVALLREAVNAMVQVCPCASVLCVCMRSVMLCGVWCVVCGVLCVGVCSGLRMMCYAIVLHT